MRNRYHALITVRTTSTRLPAKCTLPFGDGNVLDHVIGRAVNGGLIPIVCTTEVPDDDAIVEVARRHSVGLFRGSRDNKLRRWMDCCKAYDLKDFHSVDADDPFFDPALVKESLDLLRTGLDVVHPTASSSSGGASVGYSLTTELLVQVTV